jgi:hypothetical protein
MKRGRVEKETWKTHLQIAEPKINCLTSLVCERIVDLLPPLHWLGVACINRKFCDAVRDRWWHKSDGDDVEKEKRKRADLVYLHFNLLLPPTTLNEIPWDAPTMRGNTVKYLFAKDYVQCLTYMCEKLYCSMVVGLLWAVFDDVYDVVETCCENDSLDAFLWARNDFDEPSFQLLYDKRFEMFRMACDYGSMRMVRYFFEQHCTPLIECIDAGDTTEDLRKELDDWIEQYHSSNAATNGFLFVVRYVEERIAHIYEYRSPYNLDNAIMYGHLDMLRYMIDTFTFDESDVAVVHNSIGLAVERGHFAMVRFCVERFSHPDGRVLVRWARRTNAMNAGQMMAFLKRKFSLTNVDVESDDE